MELVKVKVEKKINELLKSKKKIEIAFKPSKHREFNPVTNFDKDFENVQIVHLLDFEQIPEQARNYITIRAARVFVDRVVGDQGLRAYTEQDEVRARSVLMETDLCNGDHNILTGDPSLTSVFDTYSPANVLIR